MKAMILAAGYGSRLQPLTETKPKALVELNGIPMLEMLIIKLIKAGFDDIVVNVHHFSEQIQQFLEQEKNFGVNVSLSYEEQLLDTGGGIKNAQKLLNTSDPILFHNVDVVSNLDLNAFYNYHNENGCIASLAVKERESSRYLLFNQDSYLSGWHHPAKNRKVIARRSKSGYFELAFSAIYILDPKIFNLFPAEECFSLTPWILSLAKSQNICAYVHNDDFWFDLGKLENLNKTEKVLNFDKDHPDCYYLRK